MASIQIVAYNEDESKFELNIKNLRAAMLENDIKDREIVAISIAGEARKGKSFILNFFLKYLNAKVTLEKSMKNHK